MRQVRRAAEEIASHRRSGRSAGSVALAPSATASGAGHHEQIDRSRCESNTVDCRRHRQTSNSAEPTSAMSEHGTFGRFRPLARAWPPSGGKISASAALSASACRTRRSGARSGPVLPVKGLHSLRCHDIRRVTAPAALSASVDRWRLSRPWRVASSAGACGCRRDGARMSHRQDVMSSSAGTGMTRLGIL